MLVVVVAPMATFFLRVLSRAYSLTRRVLRILFRWSWLTRDEDLLKTGVTVVIDNSFSQLKAMTSFDKEVDYLEAYSWL